MHVRHCPECDTEFLAHVERCSDCGGPLVDRDDEEPSEHDSEGAQASSPGGLPPGEYMPLVQRDQAAALHPLAARLAEAGLPYRVQVRPGFGFELRVRREEREAALVALDDLLGAADSAVPDAFDGERGAYTHCPACETPLAQGALECPDCGLLLGAETLRCEACGTELNPGSLVCPRCEGPAPE